MYLVSPKKWFSIADLSAVRYLCTVFNEDKCCVVGCWLVYLACLRSHFESKQANSITLFGPRPNNKLFTHTDGKRALSCGSLVLCSIVTLFDYVRLAKFVGEFD